MNDRRIPLRCQYCPYCIMRVKTKQYFCMKHVSLYVVGEHEYREIPNEMISYFRVPGWCKLRKR